MPAPEGTMIEIVSATRMSEREFWTTSALGLSLQRLGRDGRIEPHIAFSNRRGLPTVYNARIAAAQADHVLAFVHDDVWLEDMFFVDRVHEGLRAFDLIGVAGTRRRLPGQPSWAFVDSRFTPEDKAWLSGTVAHGRNPCGPISYFGSVPAECELLDGLFLAAKAGTLRDRGVAFDDRFDFHFYDLDLCRSARQQGLRIGTWPICMTHQSTGGFNTPAWHGKYADYIGKWQQ
jgi:GT2 family glycosyltransferase